MIRTTQQVSDLAPDAGALKAAQGLASATKWDVLDRSESAVWGEIRGSGKKPYQVRIDLTEPAFKCSCPSRKFPCKHGLGLLLIFAESPAKFTSASPPGWVADWLRARADRRQKRDALKPTKEIDTKAQARRTEKREAKVRRGIEALSSWLEDLIRQGLGTAQSQPVQFWEDAASQMVDAQSPGLARQVRQLAEIASSGEGWQERMLIAAGRLHLLLVAYRRLDDLPVDLQADVRTGVGWTTSEEELLKRDSVEDTWCVLGQVTRREDRLRVQRTWLMGRGTKRCALILQFAAGQQGFASHFTVGHAFRGKLVFYPGARPVRAIVAESFEDGMIEDALPAGASIDGAKLEFAQTLAQQPWIELWPMRLGSVVPRPATEDDGCHWSVVDSNGHLLPLHRDADCGWQLLAISGGRAIDVFGEWDGLRLRPLSVFSDGRFFVVVHGDAGQSLVRVA